MLDAGTRHRIDTARDILVGKVPDPKSQVEQITIALIYKFMDDMDAESEEFGGERTFFANGFARYGWAKLMRSGLGGHEMLNLYAEGIAKMPENPGIPLLFRDIFKNAYLPYRDPETLRAFLKVIDEFTYDHSERLGDAFEYLLSVLGSQGDAGQFRTPRHIIDFIVDVLDPKKDETILDPACGTAGFLISSYKHILKANTDGKGHSTLTPDDRARLAANFNGYDISPDMVRLSLVNLYLHGFADPHIHEYDTLTSQDRWNEYVDVILANPPFMSPKGGIKPHKRFSVQSKRSEVLFVDYIAEHLTPNGRAGVIVPEGVIFQSGTAYKHLRKMLVEQSLVAVVSLPAGVFQPYSGVKTSILLLDKGLAKRTDHIAFFKVEHDGFGLGAQRRAIDKNDLPNTAAFLKDWRHAIASASTPSAVSSSPNAILVPKDLIAANGDYNLSGERYREGSAISSSWPFVSVSEAFTKSDRNVLPEALTGPVTYIGLENITQHTGGITGELVTENPADIKSLKNVFGPREILYGKLRPNLNKVWLADREGICSTDIFVLQPNDNKVEPALYAHLFRSKHFNNAVLAQLRGAQLPRIGWPSFAELQIPLPPLEVQREIVAEIEGYQKVIDGARAVIDNYRPHIPIHPDWPMVEINNLVANEENALKAGPFGSSLKKDCYVKSGYKIYGQEQVIRGDINYGDYYIDEQKFRELETCKVKAGDVLISLVGTYGKILIVPEKHEPGIINPRLLKITLNKQKILAAYFVEAFRQEAVTKQVANLSYGGTMDILSLKVLKSLTLPLPPLETQQAIVAEIEAEQALVNANRDLIARMEKKIEAVLARVWGEEPPATTTQED